MPTLAWPTTRGPSRSIIRTTASRSPAASGQSSRRPAAECPAGIIIGWGQATAAATSESRQSPVECTRGHQSSSCQPCATLQSASASVAYPVIALPADSASAAYTSQQILYIRQIVSRRRRENIVGDMDIQEFCYAMWADMETSKSIHLLNAVVNFLPFCLMLKHSKRTTRYFIFGYNYSYVVP